MIPPTPPRIWPDPDSLGGLTDLYQLSMMAGYHAAGLANSTATFELFVRRLPTGRGYLVFAGLETTLADLLALRFSPESAEAIGRLPAFAHVDRAFIEALPDLRFRGDVWSVPEGTVVFAGEPILRVTARLPEAQWVETFLLASLAYPTLVASKASRIASVARGRSLLEFGTRRGHGPLAGLIAARSAYLAGFDATSNVEAALRFGIPCAGTMAHSWVQAFPDEATAFARFGECFPGSTMLVDTFDVPSGVRAAAAIEPPVGGVRIDSGDPLEHSRSARRILDLADRPETKVIASGDLDEFEVDRLLAAGAPIDGFGIGTELVTSRDAPALSMVYKLVELDGRGRMKLSDGKRTYPGPKQILRSIGIDGRFAGDHVVRSLDDPEGQGILIPVVAGGERVGPAVDLAAARTYCQSQRRRLPKPLAGLDSSWIYPVTYGEELEAEGLRVEAEIRGRIVPAS